MRHLQIVHCASSKSFRSRSSFISSPLWTPEKIKDTLCKAIRVSCFVLRLETLADLDAPPAKHFVFTQMRSGSEAGSNVRLIDFVYHSTLGLREIMKKREGCVLRVSC